MTNMLKTIYLALIGIVIVPTAAYLDTVFFFERSFLAYIVVCGFEWLLFTFGVWLGRGERGS